MSPVDELTASIEHGALDRCDAFAVDAVLEATVPGRRFTGRGVPVHDSRLTADRGWCGGLCSAAQLAEPAAAKDRGHAAV